VKVLLSMFPDVGKTISFKVPRFHPLVLLIRGVLRQRRVWSIEGMMMPAKYLSSEGKTYLSVTLSTKRIESGCPRLKAENSPELYLSITSFKSY
jgi:hypothetical protein